MAEFNQVIKQASRMCEACGNCNDCPLYDLVEELVDCPFFEGKLDAAAIEETVTKWAAEHPEPRYPTWQQWWEDNFPDASEAFPPCRGYFMDLGDRRKECRISCEKCKNQPIPADIAEKLGIKPIGGEENEKA